VSPERFAAAGADELHTTYGAPIPYASNLVDAFRKNVEDFSRVYWRCRQVPMAGNGIQAVSFRESSRVDGSRLGGLSSAWRCETQSVSTSRPSLQQVHASSHSLVVVIPLTEELLSRTRSIGDSVMNAAAEELAVKLDYSILRGTGVGMPEGIVNSPGTVTQTKETGQSAATILRSNVTSMLQRLWAYADGRAVWFCSRSAQKELMDGDARDLIQLGMPAADRAESAMSLCGLPLIVVEQCSPLGTAGDLILADCSEYLIGDHGAVRKAESVHVRFENHERLFKVYLETDGRSLWSTPVAAMNGSDPTQSAFVTLETRS
jgi:HK97 family phage major capsid protein